MRALFLHVAPVLLLVSGSLRGCYMHRNKDLLCLRYLTLVVRYHLVALAETMSVAWIHPQHSLPANPAFFISTSWVAFIAVYTH